MIRLSCLFICMLLLMLFSSIAQNSTSVNQQITTLNFQNDSLSHTDSTFADSLPHVFFTKKSHNIIDTIANDTIVRVIFKPYLGIKYAYIEHTAAKQRRSLPTIKEIKTRPVEKNGWFFWIILGVLCYISVVRIINPNNFILFIYSVFNLKLSEKIWEEQRSFFGFVILQLFAIYLLIASLFICNWMRMKNMVIIDNIYGQFLAIILVLFVIYLGKFLLHTFFGYLLQMKNLGIGMVSNTISVNNFVALVILPLLFFLIFNNEPLIKIILSQTIIATFVLSIVYRVIRITLLSNSFFSFPKIYLFIYLCALEILPWFVIIKYLNRF